MSWNVPFLTSEGGYAIKDSDFQNFELIFTNNGFLCSVQYEIVPKDPNLGSLGHKSQTLESSD